MVAAALFYVKNAAIDFVRFVYYYQIMGQPGKPRESRCGLTFPNKKELWLHQTTCNKCISLKFSLVAKPRKARCGIILNSLSQYNKHATTCETCIKTKGTTRKLDGWPCKCGGVFPTHKTRTEHRRTCLAYKRTKKELPEISRPEPKYETRCGEKVFSVRKRQAHNKACRKCQKIGRKAVPTKVNAENIQSLICNDLKIWQPICGNLSSHTKLIVQCFCKKTFESRVDTLVKSGMHRATSCGCKKTVTQNEIKNFIHSLGFDVSSRPNRDILDGKELDIVIPSIKVAIEYDGIYWHSTKFLSDPNIHKDKTDATQKAGYRLIHIFEDEWIGKPQVVRAYLRAILGKTENKIGARKLELRQGTDKRATKFIRENHLQGSFGKYKFWLEKDNEIYAAISFTQVGQDTYEMTRFCLRSGWQVNGGFNRLTQYAAKELHAKRFITYADIRWSEGGVYSRNGWVMTKISKPNYSYIMAGKIRRWHKMNFRLAKLRKRFGEDFCKGKTEKQICEEKGFYQIFDCGKQRWELDLTQLTSKGNSINTNSLEET